MFRTGWRCEDLCVEGGDSEKTHCALQCQMRFISADLCAGQSQPVSQRQYLSWG